MAEVETALSVDVMCSSTTLEMPAQDPITNALVMPDQDPIMDDKYMENLFILRYLVESRKEDVGIISRYLDMGDLEKSVNTILNLHVGKSNFEETKLKKKSKGKKVRFQIH